VPELDALTHCSGPTQALAYIAIVGGSWTPWTARAPQRSRGLKSLCESERKWNPLWPGKGGRRPRRADYHTGNPLADVAMTSIMQRTTTVTPAAAAVVTGWV
jgi:hypothetical protein